ncbi:MAG TPA: tetratricopeptide repeat protein [Geobacteraceae bacterium]|jgi:tetratricopeptide (TPR) repeat protein|nr:tetratricopeptide repeat protein [Geobacteraceae bacterium]
MVAILSLILLFAGAPSSWGASFHWVDRQGFHSVEQVIQVPLEHRKELPMARNRTALPFTEEEDRDGAMYVWFIFGQSGFDYPYVPARDIPKGPLFKRVQAPQLANIGWWKGFVALYDAKKEVFVTARGEVSLKAMERKRGAAAWYRFEGPPLKASQVSEKAPLGALKAVDDVLLRLEGAATFPPQVRDDAELGSMRSGLQKAIAKLESLRRGYPDDPHLLRLIGVAFRMGYNLGVPGAWDRAEAYLLRTEALAPEAPEAYISLGILYDDSDAEYAEPAEKQFRTALRHAGQEQLPQIWWGLALSLYRQGKVKEAVTIIDQLISRYPSDEKAVKLRETFLKGNKL